MPLPLPAINRLFDRLSATYGRDFMARWEGLDGDAVKASWAHELSGYAGHLHAIAWALENLPERAPNVIEFRAICRRAPSPDVPQLPRAPADPARVAAELAKLAPVRQRGIVDKRDWARRIVERQEAGDLISPYSLRLARAALRLDLAEAV